MLFFFFSINRFQCHKSHYFIWCWTSICTCNAAFLAASLATFSTACFSHRMQIQGSQYRMQLDFPHSEIRSMPGQAHCPSGQMHLCRGPTQFRSWPLNAAIITLEKFPRSFQLPLPSMLILSPSHSKSLEQLYCRQNK